MREVEGTGERRTSCREEDDRLEGIWRFWSLKEEFMIVNCIATAADYLI